MLISGRLVINSYLQAYTIPVNHHISPSLGFCSSLVMIMSWHENTFHITGPLRGEATSSWWFFPKQMQSRFCVFGLNSVLNKQLSCWWFEMLWFYHYQWEHKWFIDVNLTQNFNKHGRIKWEWHWQIPIWLLWGTFKNSHSVNYILPPTHPWFYTNVSMILIS